MSVSETKRPPKRPYQPAPSEEGCTAGEATRGIADRGCDQAPAAFRRHAWAEWSGLIERNAHMHALGESLTGITRVFRVWKGGFRPVGSVPMHQDLWRVQLGNGEVREMSLDALDAAFDQGTLNEHTPVLAPGASSWERLGKVAGLDEEEVAPNSAMTPSLSPMAIGSFPP